MPASNKSQAVVKDQLNRSSPANRDAKLGDTVNDLITNFNALLAKLDSNHGAATDHAATLSVTQLGQR